MPYCFSRYLCKQKYNMKLMKKMGKRLSKALVMLLMTTSVENANAQAEWNYSYDATGNRTQRTVNNGSSARKKASSNKNLFEDGRINAILDREHNKLKIETLGNSDASVSIFDLSGKELISIVIEDISRNGFSSVLPFSIGNVEDRMMQFADANGIELASHELYMSEGNQAARSNCSSSRRCHRSSHRGSTWLLLSRCKDKHFFRYLQVFLN